MNMKKVSILIVMALSLTFAVGFIFAANAKSGNAANGEKLFNKTCFACHQKGGVGKVGLAPSIRNRDFLALASDEFIKKTIHDGRKGTAMTPRPDLTENNVNDIIAYLRALPIYNPVKVKVDWKVKFSGNAPNGDKLFTRYCAYCHGSKGEGYIKGGSGPGIGLPGFLAAASDDYILQTTKLGRIGTAMRRFVGALGLANLSENDVKDIIAYLRSLN